MNNLMTVAEAANKIGVSPDTIRRWEKKGLIKGHRNDLNYRVFNLTEVKRVHDRALGRHKTNGFKILRSRKRTKFKVIDLFAGAGGTALGLENSGLKHVLLVENNKDAVATLRKNRSKWKVIGEDIAKIDFRGIKADIVEGGFPCQAFSYAGKRLGFNDIRGTLFFEFARCIKEVRPKIVVGENVRGLINHDEGKTLETMVDILDKELGYNVITRLIRTQYLDVPQKRERLIILAVRKDLDLPFLVPLEQDYIISLGEVIGNVGKSPGQKYSKKKKKILSLIPAGGYWKDLPIKLQKEYMGASFYMGGGRTGMARRLSWDEPSLTLTCSPAQKQTERCHPEETRPLSIKEYSLIQTFPKSWKFVGSMSSQYKQIGNAFPVNAAFHIGRCLIAMLRKKPDLKKMVLLEKRTTVKLL